MNIIRISAEIQKEIWEAPILNFVSVAPSWKLQSLSTNCRAALNFWKRNKKSGLSLNDICIGGSAPLDMSRTARFFKSGLWGWGVDSHFKIDQVQNCGVAK